MNVITGEKIVLKPIDLSDSEQVVRWRNQPEIKKYFIDQNDFTIEGQQIWIEQFVNTGKVAQFIIIDKMENRPMGVTYLRDIDRNKGIAEYGIFIGELTEQGKGIGTEAAKLILAFAFEKLKLDKVFLRVLAENKIAIQSYLKVGFIQDAYVKDDVKINDVYHDIIYMSVKK